MSVNSPRKIITPSGYFIEIGTVQELKLLSGEKILVKTKRIERIDFGAYEVYGEFEGSEFFWKEVVNGCVVEFDINGHFE